MKINILFIATIALFIALIVRGYKKGFLRIAVTFVGMIVIIIAAKRITPYLSDFIINNTKTYDKIENKINERFAEANRQYDNTVAENQVLTINSYELPDVIKTSLIDNNTESVYQSLLVNVFEDYVSAYLAKGAVKALSFVLMFAVVFIAFKIVLKVVDIISKIPIIKGLNKYAGAILGFIESLFIVWVVFFLILVFIGNSSGSSFLKMISENGFLSFLFNNNLLMGAVY